MPSASSKQTIAQEMFESLTRAIPDAPVHIQQNIHAYLVGTRSWDALTIASVNHCIAEFESLNARIDALRNEDEFNLSTLYIPAVIAWGSTQPWASDIKTAQLIEALSYDQDQNDPQSASAMLGRCSHFLSTTVQLAPLFPSAPPSEILTTIFGEMLTRNSFWDPNAIESGVLGAYLVNAGRLASTQTPSLVDNWALCVNKVLAAASFQSAMVVSQTLLKSDLPATLALKAHEGASPVLWTMAYDVLRPMLPQNERECFERLPWAQPSYNAVLMVKHEKEIYADTNRRLVRSYCPDLYQLLDLAASLDDWCVKTRMDAWVDRFQSGQIQPSLPLPSNMEPT